MPGLRDFRAREADIEHLNRFVPAGTSLGILSQCACTAFMQAKFRVHVLSRL
jgi:hypothetical protein